MTDSSKTAETKDEKEAREKREKDNERRAEEHSKQEEAKRRDQEEDEKRRDQVKSASQASREQDERDEKAKRDREKQDRDQERERQERDKHFQTRQLGDRPEVSPRLAPDQSASKQANTMEARGAMVSMYSRGFIVEAKTHFSTLDGATDAAWQSLEKMLAPIRAFVLDGTMQYPIPDQTTEYAGVPVPEPEQPPENPDPPATRARGEYAGPRQPGNLSADVENEIKERGGKSLDANPGGEPGGGKTAEEHLAREKEAQDKSKQ